MRTESRKIRLEDGSSIDVFLAMNWLEVPIETVATIRAALDVLMSLDVGAAEAETPAPSPAPKPTVGDMHPCGFDGCDREFATIGARAIHRSKTHSVGKKHDELQRQRDAAAPVETAQDVDQGVEDPAEPEQFTCETCLAVSSNYTELTEHTRQWHNRFPHRSERHGDEPDPLDDDVPAVEVEEEPPPAPRAYHCDDCEWSTDDGRDLFKHTEKHHARVPHTWERQLRTAAERVA